MHTALQVNTCVVHKQARLLRRMLDSGLDAILVKIAAIGARRWCEISVVTVKNQLAFCWPHCRCVLAAATASATKRDGSLYDDANDTNTQGP